VVTLTRRLPDSGNASEIQMHGHGHATAGISGLAWIERLRDLRDDMDRTVELDHLRLRHRRAELGPDTGGDDGSGSAEWKKATGDTKDRDE
jgi:hypothetical protein